MNQLRSAAWLFALKERSVAAWASGVASGYAAYSAKLARLITGLKAKGFTPDELPDYVRTVNGVTVRVSYPSYAQKREPDVLVQILGQGGASGDAEYPTVDDFFRQTKDLQELDALFAKLAAAKP